jgi:hypothetical protein
VTPQRIDSIKGELTSVLGIGDLGNDESVDCDILSALRLEEEDVELLREAGLFQISSTRSKDRKLKHIVFMDDENEGDLILGAIDNIILKSCLQPSYTSPQPDLQWTPGTLPLKFS